MKKIWYLKEEKKEKWSKDSCVIKFLCFGNEGQMSGKLELSGFPAANERDFPALFSFFYMDGGTQILLWEDTFPCLACKSDAQGKLFLTLGRDACKKISDKLSVAQLAVVCESGRYFSSEEGRRASASKHTEEAVPKEVNPMDGAIAASQEEQEAIDDRTGDGEDFLEENSFGRKVIHLAVLTEDELEFRAYVHNSFLLHGFYNYGHVVIEEQEGGKKLGVPGNYFEREQMVASMFGFPEFVPVRRGELISGEKPLQTGSFGYYFTELK